MTEIEPHVTHAGHQPGSPCTHQCVIHHRGHYHSVAVTCPDGRAPVRVDVEAVD